MGNLLMTPKLWDVAMIGASLAHGQYFGDYDHSFNQGHFSAPIASKQFQPGSQSAMTGLFTDPSWTDKVSMVVVSFKGLDDMEPQFNFDILDNIPYGEHDDCLLDFGNIKSVLSEIRSSSWNSGEQVQDYDDSTQYCMMNDYLMEDYGQFETGSVDLASEIIDMLELCDTLYENSSVYNNGKHCELYFTGHSKGGVFAFATAVKMRSVLKAYYNDDEYQPYVMTYGMPPALLNYRGGCTSGVLSDHDKILNFVNVHKDVTGYLEDQDWDYAATDIAFRQIGRNEHKGTNIILATDSNTVKAWDADDIDYQTAELEPQFKEIPNDFPDLISLSAHTSEVYRDNLRTLANVELVFENGFQTGIPYWKNEHCASNNCRDDHR